MGTLVKTFKRQINRGENGKCYEAFSPQHHPAVHAIQTAGEGWQPFQQAQEIRGRKFLAYYRRNFTVAW